MASSLYGVGRKSDSAFRYSPQATKPKAIQIIQYRARSTKLSQNGLAPMFPPALRVLDRLKLDNILVEQPSETEPGEQSMTA